MTLPHAINELKFSYHISLFIALEYCQNNACYISKEIFKEIYLIVLLPDIWLMKCKLIATKQKKTLFIAHQLYFHKF